MIQALTYQRATLVSALEFISEQAARAYAEEVEANGLVVVLSWPCPVCGEYGTHVYDDGFPDDRYCDAHAEYQVAEPDGVNAENEGGKAA